MNKTEKKTYLKKATAWNLSSWDVNYKSRLSELKNLPPLYFDLIDLLTLLTLLQGNDNIKMAMKFDEKAMNTQETELIAIDKSRKKKTEQNFWVISRKPLNIIDK